MFCLAPDSDFLLLARFQFDNTALQRRQLRLSVCKQFGLNVELLAGDKIKTGELLRQ